MGINPLLQQNMQSAGLAGIDRLAGNAMFPQSQMDKTQYAVSSQMPTSAEVVNAGYEPKTNAYTGLPMANFAKGGIARFAKGGSPFEDDPNNFASDLTRAYQATLGRDPSMEELRANVDALNRNPDAYSWIVERLADDPSAAKHYAEINKPIVDEEGNETPVAAYDPVQTATDLKSMYAHYTPSPPQGGIGGFFNKLGPWSVPLAAAAFVAPELIAMYGAEGAGAAGAASAAGAGGGGAGTLTTAELLGGAGGSFVPTAGSGASFTLPSGVASAGGAGLPSLKEAYNAYKGVTAAANLMNTLTGGGGQAPSGGYQNGTGTGYNAFDPGMRVTGLPELVASRDQSPWKNLLPEITLSKLSEFAPEREMAGGGKTDSDDIFKDLTPRERKLLELELMAQSLTKRPGEEYSGLTVPAGLLARLGASANLDENSKLRAGLSGVAMAVPGQHGVMAAPGSMDIGYSTKAGPGDLDLSAFRSINAIPGKGYAQGVNARYSIPFAQGGDISHLGGYSDGGRLLKGPGDGMSDNIPASIGDKQPARLADGEFVVPADVVSHLGNGSTDAGAKQLYAMMDKVRKARTGNKKQGKQINPNKFLPKG